MPIVCVWSWQCELLKVFFFGVNLGRKHPRNASEAYGYFDQYRCMISYHEWSFLLKWLLKNVRIDRNVLLKLSQSVNLNQGDNGSDGSPWLVFCANLSLGLSALKLITRAFWQAGGSNVRDTADGRNPVIYKVLYIPGGAGFLPSTVCRSQLYKHFGCVGLRLLKALSNWAQNWLWLDYDDVFFDSDRGLPYCGASCQSSILSESQGDNAQMVHSSCDNVADLLLKQKMATNTKIWLELASARWSTGVWNITCWCHPSLWLAHTFELFLSFEGDFKT